MDVHREYGSWCNFPEKGKKTTGSQREKQGQQRPVKDPGIQKRSYRSAIPALRRLSQKDPKVQASLGYMTSSYLKKSKTVK